MPLQTPRSTLPVLFVSHGAAIFTTSAADPTHRFLRGMEDTVSAWAPRAILVISAHYAATPLRLTGSGALATIHDHPARDVYAYRYPGRGSDELTNGTLRALADAGLGAEVDAGRGLDHGAWVPLSLIHPSGAVPVGQLSLDARESPTDHLALGRALAPLREQGVLLVASGGVTHNQEVFRRGYFGGSELGAPESFSSEFDAWVSDLVTAQRGASRAEALCGFQTHPLAHRAHPTIEHFLPLLVAVGAGWDAAGRKLFSGYQHSLSTTVLQLG